MFDSVFVLVSVVIFVVVVLFMVPMYNNSEKRHKGPGRGSA
jgi:hypothetical protein